MKRLVGLAIVLIFAGCTSESQQELEETGVDQSVLLHAWELVELHGSGVHIEKPVYIAFHKSNKVTGFAGCNRLNGKFTVKAGARISFGQLGVTRMTCPDIEVENKFLKTLKAGGKFKVNKNKMMIETEDGQEVAVFSLMEGHDIVNRKWKLKTLEGRPIAKVKSKREPQFFILNEDNTMAGFAGCNAFNGEYEMEVGKRIRFKSNMAATLKACPDVKVDEQAYLAIFGMANRYSLSGDTLSLHVNNDAELAVFVAEPATK